MLARFGLMFVLHLLGAMGAGDVKLFAAHALSSARIWCLRLFSSSC